jgi:hypothetical protein
LALISYSDARTREFFNTLPSLGSRSLMLVSNQEGEERADIGEDYAGRPRACGLAPPPRRFAD